MRHSLSLVLAAILLAALLTSPVSADPEFREETVWLTCVGPTPSQTINHQYLEAERIGWDRTAPTGSFEDGDGCHQQDYPVGGDAWQLTMQGTFTGNLDTLSVELYALTSHVDPLRRLRVSAVIDDEYGGGQGGELRPVVHDTDDPAIKRVVVGLDDIGVIDDPDGPGSIEHPVEIFVSGPYSLIDPLTTWLLDTEDTPSSVTFNGDMTGLPTQWPHTRFPRDPHIEDRCFDLEIHPVANTYRVNQVAAPDLEEVTFVATTDADGTLTGFDTLVDLCGGATPASGQVRLAWQAADQPGCDQVTGWLDVAFGTLDHDSFDAAYGNSCTVDLPDGATSTTTIFREELPPNAVTPEPSGTVIHLRFDQLSAEAAATLPLGAVFADPVASSTNDHGLPGRPGVDVSGFEVYVNADDVSDTSRDFVLG